MLDNIAEGPAPSDDDRVHIVIGDRECRGEPYHPGADRIDEQALCPSGPLNGLGVVTSNDSTEQESVTPHMIDESVRRGDELSGQPGIEHGRPGQEALILDDVEHCKCRRRNDRIAAECRAV